MGERQGFYLYHEDIEALQALTSEQKGILLDALFMFSVEGKRLKTDNVAIGVAFGMMSSKIARDAEKYRQKSERYSHSAKQRESNRRIVQNDHNFDNSQNSQNSQNFQNSHNFQNSENPAKHTKIVPTVPVTVTETVPVTVNNVRELYPRTPAPTPFIPPTLEDVDEFCEAQGIDVDPVRFVMYYTARGWKMGTTPMTDWKAAVRLWEQRDKAEAQKQTPAPIDDDEPVNWYEG